MYFDGQILMFEFGEIQFEKPPLYINKNYIVLRIDRRKSTIMQVEIYGSDIPVTPT